MESYQDWQNNEYGYTQEQYPYYSYELNSDYKTNKHLSKVPYITKYNQYPNISESKKQKNVTRKEISNQYRTYINKNEKRDYNYSYISKENEPRNSTKYYSDHNKYLTLFNSETKRYERSNATFLNDGVLRGYTDNCSFYISGSSNLKPKTTIKDKFLNKNNNNSDNYYRYNKNYHLDNKYNRQKKVYESRTQVINPIDYKKKEVKKNKDNKNNDNKYNKKNYNSKTIINTSLNTINKNEEKNKYQSLNKGPQNKNNINNEKQKYNYSRRSYINSEPNYNIKNNNNKRTLNTENITKPLIPTKNIINIEPKTTIQSFSDNTNYSNTNKKKVYKTSTNTNLEEKNKNNYYQTIIEKKPYENRKRNNTPNISRLENNNLNNTMHYISSGKRNFEKSNNENRNNYKSAIPHNKGFKYKNNSNIEENIINKTEGNYQPKQTLLRKNSNSNINSNLNKNRYNFPERPKLREYGTKTEVHSFINNKYSRAYFNNNEKEKINDIPKNNNRNTKYKNYIVDIKKIEPKKEEKNKNRYVPRSFSITPAIRSGRKYGVQTESTAMNRDRNYTRNNEYEVTDITSYKKNQELKDKYSKYKNTIPKAVKQNIKDNKPSNNIKKYSTFERSLKNIKENEKEIEKEQKSFYINRDNSLNNHIIFISDVSKNKKYYRTSTQRQAFRPHGYTLGNISEYEVPTSKYQKYGKKEDIQKVQKNYTDKRKNKNIFNIKINKNNYFNAMKNLEEEIEVDDDNEQVEYLHPKSLSKIESKPKESKYSFNLNKKHQPKKENKSHYTITTITKKEDKNKVNKDNKDNKERNTNGELKKNNITQKINVYKQQNKNINNYGYHESSDIKNPKENKFLTIHKSTKIKDNTKENKNENKKDIKNEKTNQNKIINITINKPQEEKPKPNQKKIQKYIPRYIIPQHITQKPIISEQPKKITQQIKPQSQSQTKNRIQPKIQIQTHSQTKIETQKQNQQKIKSIQIQPSKPAQQVQITKNQKEQEIKSKYQQKKENSQIRPQYQIKTQKLELEHQEKEPQEIEHQEEENQEEENIKEINNIKDNDDKNKDEIETMEEIQQNEDNNLRKSNYTSYFGDFNNNYYEIKGVSGSGEKYENEEEEEEENEENENEKENTKKRYDEEIQLVRNVNFGIQSENLCVPAQPGEDKEEKEADEQIMEEDEQNDINFENGQAMEEIEGDEKKENYVENEEEGEMVGDEMINEEDNGNEENDENEMMEAEEIEENIIEENNYNEEDENNDENENEEY